LERIGSFFGKLVIGLSFIVHQNPKANAVQQQFDRLLVTMYQKKLISTNFENIAWETSSKLSSGLPEWGLNGVT
jgi:hypothetical protein